MKRKVIFEIPIYSMKEKEFNKRWRREKDKLYEECILAGHNDKTKVETWINELFYPKTVWKFNQIIGYIRLMVTKQDVVFEIWLARGQRFHANSSVKKFLSLMPTNGLHFSVGISSDDEIKAKICCMLDFIKAKHVADRFYIDDTLFHNVIKYLSIRGIIDEM